MGFKVALVALGIQLQNVILQAIIHNLVVHVVVKF